MRESQTKSEQGRIKKYEAIVKEQVDNLDPIGLFPGAPDDEYKNEIRDITLKLAGLKTPTDIAQMMFVVFAYHFDIHEAKPVSQYLEAAKKIIKINKE